MHHIYISALEFVNIVFGISWRLPGSLGLNDQLESVTSLEVFFGMNLFCCRKTIYIEPHCFFFLVYQTTSTTLRLVYFMDFFSLLRLMVNIVLCS